MTAPHPSLLLAHTRFTVHSTVEGPLTVESDTVERALYLGLQLLEREHRIEDFTFSRGEDGSLIAVDLLRSERFAVTRAA